MRRMISQKDQNKIANLAYENGRFGVIEHHQEVPAITQNITFNPGSIGTQGSISSNTRVAIGFDLGRAPQGIEYSGSYTVDDGEAKFVSDSTLEADYIIWKLTPGGVTYFNVQPVTFYGNDMEVPSAVKTAGGVTYQAYSPGVPAYDEFHKFAFED